MLEMQFCQVKCSLGIIRSAILAADQSAFVVKFMQIFSFIAQSITIILRKQHTCLDNSRVGL
jgi:hypothetical protein